jgi:acyl-CoA thioesterase FadM
MPRIKLNVPDHFSFSTIIPVRITDVNYGGHVGNDSFLSLIHEARVQFLKSLQCTEMDFYGASLIMSDVAIEFKTELYYGSSIKAYVTITEFSRVGFDVLYKLVTSEDEKVVAIAKSGMICFDYQLKKIVAVPEEVKRKFETVSSV